MSKTFEQLFKKICIFLHLFCLKFCVLSLIKKEYIPIERLSLALYIILYQRKPWSDFVQNCISNQA